MTRSAGNAAVARLLRPAGAALRRQPLPAAGATAHPEVSPAQFPRLRAQVHHEIWAEQQVIRNRALSTKEVHRGYGEQYVIDWIGGVSFPPVYMWDEPLGIAGSVNPMLHQIDEATTVDELDARQRRAVAQLERAADAYNRCYRRWIEYRDGTIRGVERGQIDHRFPAELTADSRGRQVPSLQPRTATNGFVDVAERIIYLPQ